LEFVKILIFIAVDIFKHCQENKKIKRADQILPEVYGTTLSMDNPKHRIQERVGIPSNCLMKPNISLSQA
jgi:hypothetical protein